MSTRIPKYRLHKGSGQALVQINGQRICLGKYGSDESKEKFQRLVAEWLVSVREQANDDKRQPSELRRYQLPVNETLLCYWKFAQSYYVKDGRPTQELECMKQAIRPLRRLYGATRAQEFGPLALKAVGPKNSAHR